MAATVAQSSTNPLKPWRVKYRARFWDFATEQQARDFAAKLTRLMSRK